MVTQNVVILSIPQVIDLALNSPEIGAVNFNLLHNLLHIMAQQLQMTNTNVEFCGKDAEKIQMLVAAAAGRQNASILLTEYSIKADDKGGKLMTEVVDKKSTPKIPSPLQENEEVLVLVQPDNNTAPQMTIYCSLKTITGMQEDINKLKQNLDQLMDLPKNSDLMVAMKTSKDKPLAEMLQLMSLMKRVDATETGLQKLGSLVEDLTGEMQYQDIADEIESEVAKTSRPATPKEKPGAQKGSSVDKVVDAPVQAKEKHQEGGEAQAQEAEGKGEKQQPLKKEKDPSKKDKAGREHDTGALDSSSAESPPFPEPSSPVKASSPAQTSGDKKNVPNREDVKIKENGKNKEEDLSRLPTIDAILFLQKDIMKIKREIKKIKSKEMEDGGGTKDRKKKKSHTVDDIIELDAKVRDSAETVQSIDHNFHNEILNMQTQFSIIEMDVNGIIEKLNAIMPGSDSGVDSIADLFKKVQEMHVDIENIAEITSMLRDELTQKKALFENINETVELLKTIKADKEDVEDALADKADKCAINRKVSHDQFDTACDELSRGIEEALDKLTNQELLWQQALDEIQFEISNKLDKMELGPLRDFINNKLRMLQERMKSLTALKKEQEAAGTKSKFLRNVNCISCDKDVVMRKQMDASLMPQPRALPPSRSMAPYLAYELDALRKQQKTASNSRNLNHFESAMTGAKSPRMDDHVCNRYCGGSHTVTTPQQRVTRMGHFLAQWGPGAVPIVDGVPTKEEPKQERKQSTEPGASGDQKKVPQKATPEAASQSGEKRPSKTSTRSGSAQNLSKAAPDATKASTPPASGPGGDDKTSAGSHGKVKSHTGSAKGSQGSAKKGSKTSRGSASGSLKAAKQGTQEGSKEAISGDKAKDVPEEIVEETASEVAAADAPSKEPSVTTEEQKGDVRSEEGESPPEMPEDAYVEPAAEE